jgi:hypothetical protein
VDLVWPGRGWTLTKGQGVVLASADRWRTCGAGSHWRGVGEDPCAGIALYLAIAGLVSLAWQVGQEDFINKMIRAELGARPRRAATSSVG